MENINRLCWWSVSKMCCVFAPGEQNSVAFRASLTDIVDLIIDQNNTFPSGY